MTTAVTRTHSAPHPTRLARTSASDDSSADPEKPEVDSAAGPKLPPGVTLQAARHPPKQSVYGKIVSYCQCNLAADCCVASRLRPIPPPD